MKTGIGIDTGGTYTDAVVYDFESKKILGSAKALTTRDDLSTGIGNALDALPADLVSSASIISLSTTLATNACVENKGGRARLLFIGVSRHIVESVGSRYGLPDADEIIFWESDCDHTGDIASMPDWDTLLAESDNWINDSDAAGIVSLHAMKNNAILEKKARELLKERFSLPVVCGHELFSDLNSIQRGAGTLLNARLIPVIGGFLEAIKKALSKRNIKAPVIIVRSDGSVMSEGFTSVRPVETLLCGPAASVMGGIELTGEQDCIVVDMGGTTTDVSIVRNGEPLKASGGINVGKWKTFVKGIYIDTFGLGGDSAVRFDKHRNMLLESVRVVPLSITAASYPQIKDRLHSLLISQKQHTLPLHEFFILINDINTGKRYTQRELKLCEALKQAPLIYQDAAEAAGADIYNFDTSRLEKEGIIIRSGLTPTDIMHIRGDFNAYDRQAALYGLAFAANSTGHAPEVLSEMIYDAVKKKLYLNIVRILLENRYPRINKEGIDKELELIIAQSWDSFKNSDPKGLINHSFSTPATLVGIGAPTHIFLPDVAKALGTKYVIPEHASVANALGSVIGNITAAIDIEVKPLYTVYGISSYMVYGKDENISAESREKAVEIAVAKAEASAVEEAKKRGASGDITVTSSVAHDISESKDNAEIYLGSRVSATAIGRFSLVLKEQNDPVKH